MLSAILHLEGIMTWSHTRIYELRNDLQCYFLLLIGNLSPYQITRRSAGLQLHGNSFSFRPFSTLRHFTHPPSINHSCYIKNIPLFPIAIYCHTSLEERIVDVLLSMAIRYKNILFFLSDWMRMHKTSTDHNQRPFFVRFNHKKFDVKSIN